ncbi:MAG TPA: HAMP domain-containing sensor histidine kinase, partial [Polyangiaceae bacterium]|nr:HAMP domain-containing sensor histidine kinase [Polyangiaceae bacterium]
EWSATFGIGGVAARAFSPAVALRWLVSLRWHAVAGQALAIAFAAGVLHAELPFGALAAVAALTALSNAAIAVWLRRAPAVGADVVALALALDVLSLTGLLGLSGGDSNPFASFYLVLVALAALVLEPRRAALVFGLCAAGYAALALGATGPVPLGLEAARLRAPALGLTALALALVLLRFSRALRERQDAFLRAQRSAARAETVASLGTLAAGAAHELGSPLGTIALAANELEASMLSGDAEQALDDARLIRDEVERCRAIVQRMGARAGAPSGEVPAWLSAPALCDEVLAALPPSGRARVVARPGEGSRFALPPRALVQSLACLVQNALEADEAGAVILRVERSDGTVRFVVEDEGPGMPPALLERLGEPFLTTKPPGRGMGLGVFLCAAFAEACRGELRFESSPGRGTRATLELPAARGGP